MFLRKLGKRGAEMVEYAIVLACIAAVGVGFYSSNDSKLTGVLDSLFGKVTNVVSLGSGVSPNGAPLTDNDKIALNTTKSKIDPIKINNSIPYRLDSEMEFFYSCLTKN